MAKKSSVETNNYRKRLIKKLSARRAKMKALAKDRSLSLKERFQANLKLAQLPRNSSSIRYRNRCVLTGRARGVHREYGLSRIMIRDLALAGELPGVKKASW